MKTLEQPDHEEVSILGILSLALSVYVLTQLLMEEFLSLSKAARRKRKRPPYNPFSPKCEPYAGKIAEYKLKR